MPSELGQVVLFKPHNFHIEYLLDSFLYVNIDQPKQDFKPNRKLLEHAHL